MNRIPAASAAPDQIRAPANGPPAPNNGRPKTQRRTRPNAEPNAPPDDIFDRLAAPFPADSVLFKPQSVSGNRARAVAYVDARCVMDRLDDTVGPAGWQDEYETTPSGEVKCTLRIKIAEEWVGKSDVGSRSDQPDEGDQLKAAFSDALKRAAVKWGIGRYLYHLAKQWVGYDPQRRQFTEAPKLPAWALPGASDDPGHAPPPSSPGAGAEASKELARPSPAHLSPARSSASAASATTTQPARPNGLPTDGRSLFRWLKDKEKALIDDHVCRAGELVEYIAQAGAAAGHGTAIVRWPPAGVTHGVNSALEFIAEREAGSERAGTSELTGTDPNIPF